MLAPRLRWALPVAVLLAGIGVGVVPGLTAAAAPQLPAMSAQALVARMLSSKVRALSGDFQTSTDLGLPQLPTSDLPGGSNGVASLLTGTGTFKVWLDATAGRFRVAWIQSGAEEDLFVNRGRLDTWNSTTRSVGEARLPMAAALHGLSGGHRSGPPAATPQSVAAGLVGALAPDSSLSVGRSAWVAGRSAYVLSIAPRSAGSLERSVDIAIDSATGLPLRLQVFARGQRSPALAIGYTHLTLGAPPSSDFAFTVPPGAKVHQLVGNTIRRHRRAGAHPGGARAGRTRLVGSGWAAVMVVPHVSLAGLGGILAGAAAHLPNGGQLIRTSLLTAYLAPDGTLYAGAVEPSVLLADAARG